MYDYMDRTEFASHLGKILVAVPIGASGHAGLIQGIKSTDIRTKHSACSK